MYRTISTGLLAAAICLACVPEDPAAPADVVKDADLVVLAEVRDISYANSEGAASIPHTYVTLAVEAVLKGSYDSPNRDLVLRFAGGVGRMVVALADLDFSLEPGFEEPGEPESTSETSDPLAELPEEVSIDYDQGVAYIDGAIFRVSRTTYFDVGERSVLMIKRNGEIQCPLVGCAKGRFRVVEGSVFSESGRELSLSEEGELLMGASHPLDEVNNHQMGNVLLERVGAEEDEGDDGVLELPNWLYPVGQSLALESFLAWVGNQVAAEQQLDPQGNLALVKNLDPGTPFEVPIAVAMPIPDTTHGDDDPSSQEGETS